MNRSDQWEDLRVEAARWAKWVDDCCAQLGRNAYADRIIAALRELGLDAHPSSKHEGLVALSQDGMTMSYADQLKAGYKAAVMVAPPGLRDDPPGLRDCLAAYIVSWWVKQHTEPSGSVFEVMTAWLDLR